MEDESVMEPWVESLITDLNLQTKNNVKVWCGILIRMGVEEHIKLEWSSMFKKHIADLQEEMIADVTSREKVMMDGIVKLLKKSEKLCKTLHETMPAHGSKFLSLYEEKNVLEKRIAQYEEIVEKRTKELSKLQSREKRLCLSLGCEPKHFPEFPLPTAEEISEYSAHLENLESEKFKREEVFLMQKCMIIDIIKELHYKPNLEFEQLVCSAHDHTFLVTDSNMCDLEMFYNRLLKQQTDIKENICDLREKICALWEVLDEDLVASNNFLEKYPGNSIDVLEALKFELKRCETLKRANIEVFVQKLRSQLAILWDTCHYTEEQRNEFHYFNDECYTEDLLSIHDIEISRMKSFHSQNSRIFTLLDKREELWNKLVHLENGQTADRFKNRAGQLLQEEKERNLVRRRLPKIEQELLDLATAYENRTGKAFLSWGRSIEDVIASCHEARNEEKMLKIAKRQQEFLTPTPAAGTSQNITRSPRQPGKSTLSIFTPATPKKRVASQMALSGEKKKMKVSEEIRAQGTRTAPAKIASVVASRCRSRYSLERNKRIQKCRRFSKTNCLKDANNKKSEPLSATIDYEDFKVDLSSSDTKAVGCRSTLLPHELTSPLALPLSGTPLRPCGTNGNNTPGRATPRRALTPKSPRGTTKLSTAKGLKLFL